MNAKFEKHSTNLVWTLWKKEIQKHIMDLVQILWKNEDATHENSNDMEVGT
jgi:hypothetical protein